MPKRRARNKLVALRELERKELLVGVSAIWKKDELGGLGVTENVEEGGLRCVTLGDCGVGIRRAECYWDGH